MTEIDVARPVQRVEVRNRNLGIQTVNTMSRSIALTATLFIFAMLAAIIMLSTRAQASFFLADTYDALGGNSATDNLAEANEVLSELLERSNTNEFRAVVQNNAGSATWIGNSDTKSYFMTAAHVVNSASTNTLTTYEGVRIPPVVGSVLHTQDGDFGLLEYNGLLDPELFGGESLVLMDLHLANNFAGAETILVGYGELTIGSRRLSRTRMLSLANLTRLDGAFRTQSTIATTFDPDRPFAGVATGGDSGGGVFLNLDGTNVLIGAASAGNLTSGMVYTNIYVHRDFIDSIVPEGVFTWYTDFIAEPPTAINYQDTFDNDGLGVNAGDGGGGVSDSFNNAPAWTDDGALSAGDAGAGFHIWKFTTEETFAFPEGFAMEVVFDQLFDDNNGSNGSAPFNANHFSFGLTTTTTSSNYLDTNGAIPESEGIGVSLTNRNGSVDIGLLEANLSAGTTTTLAPFTSSTVGVGQVFTLTVDAEGNYDWALNGETGAGTTALDLSQVFQFTARTQASAGNRIQSVSISPIGGNACLLGDVNQDGTVNFLDISPFIGILSVGGFQCEADCDGSGIINFLDISPFITILSSGE